MTLKTLLWLVSFGLALPVAADVFLVEDGQPQAEIVISEGPTRSIRLAAAELQETLAKISGAPLPIRTRASGEGTVPIYVGQSPGTEKLGITADGLEHGAYRIVSGENWLVLIGDDTDFVPREPWAKNNGGISSGKLQADWEAASGLPYGVPNAGMYKHRARLPGTTGKPEGATTEPKEMLEIWSFDERGSYNAVCGLLRSLGARWYQPGDLGEVLPDLPTIPLPEIDETTTPDFPLRRFNGRFSTVSDATRRWMMRLGLRDRYGFMVAHGMANMTGPESLLEQHPEWFALFGGKRDNSPGDRHHHLCYSNEELLGESVRWARAQFDIYDFESVSIMPPDAYISICQCHLCEGKQVDEMGPRGKLSNHVWDFVNQVAKEVGKTHPDKTIVCCAYGANTNPPTNIDQLEPNVQVVIVGGRRPRSNLPEQREAVQQLREGWLTKTARPIMIFENYPFTDRGFYQPAFVGRTIGESINATKGVSSGEDIWLSFGRNFEGDGLALDHFQVYFTARMYWGGKAQSVTALIDEYCDFFYGPAGEEMKAFFAYCEDHWQSMTEEKETVDQALGLFAAAMAKADAGSVYAKRLGVIDTFLETLRSKSEQLGQKRGPLPKLRTVRDVTDVTIDGRLDEPYWRECLSTSTTTFRELQTGSQPHFATTVKAGWDRGGNHLYFGIHCEEQPGEPLNITATKHDDQAIWYGDVIEILLSTDSHKYYQIAVNPAGAMADLDRGADKSAALRWESQAEVATHVANDHWTVEIRIPVTDDENDPLNQVVGRLPSGTLPWHINLCRQRIRENGSEHSAFSPTGAAGFHVPTKFGYFHDGSSTQFDVDPTVTDFLIEFRAAERLISSKTADKALTAFLTLAEREDLTPLQRSRTLQHAATCARLLGDHEQATALTARIPLEPIAKTVTMENHLAQRDWEGIVETFAEEDFAAWPFWQVGAGAFARGRAYVSAKKGKEADADLILALETTADSRTRMSILRTLGQSRETVLQDDEAALEIYRQMADTTTNTGSAEYYYGIQGAARILTRKGAFDEALAILDRIPADRISGSWSSSMQLVRGQTLEAAGRRDAALETFQAVIANPSVLSSHQATAEAAIQRLQ